jgi:hypothetical protein
LGRRSASAKASPLGFRSTIAQGNVLEQPLTEVDFLTMPAAI